MCHRPLKPCSFYIMPAMHASMFMHPKARDISHTCTTTVRQASPLSASTISSTQGRQYIRGMVAFFLSAAQRERGLAWRASWCSGGVGSERRCRRRRQGDGRQRPPPPLPASSHDATQVRSSTRAAKRGGRRTWLGWAGCQAERTACCAVANDPDLGSSTRKAACLYRFQRPALPSRTLPREALSGACKSGRRLLLLQLCWPLSPPGKLETVTATVERCNMRSGYGHGSEAARSNEQRGCSAVQGGGAATRLIKAGSEGLRRENKGCSRE